MFIQYWVIRFVNECYHIGCFNSSLFLVFINRILNKILFLYFNNYKISRKNKSYGFWRKSESTEKGKLYFWRKPDVLVFNPQYLSSKCMVFCYIIIQWNVWFLSLYTRDGEPMSRLSQSDTRTLFQWHVNLNIIHNFYFTFQINYW